MQLQATARLRAMVLLATLAGSASILACADRPVEPERAIVPSGGHASRDVGVDAEKIGIQSWLGDSNKRADLVAGTGAHWTRVPMQWEDLQPSSEYGTTRSWPSTTLL